jgi:hypothetical protein
VVAITERLQGFTELPPVGGCTPKTVEILSKSVLICCAEPRIARKHAQARVKWLRPRVAICAYDLGPVER